jgi:hypothetical protein
MSNVNHELKSIFIHIPKCAGSSMEACPPWNKGSGHKTLQSFSKIKNFSSYYKWCFVRNPWDRAVSAWDTCPEIKREGVDTFKKFIEALYIGRHQIQNLPYIQWTKNSCQKIPNLPVQRIHFLPMLPMIKVDGVVKIDYIGRFENLKKDWDRLTSRVFNFEKMKLPKHNMRNKKKPYQEFYTKDLINKVGEIYREDIDFFDYKYNN